MYSFFYHKGWHRTTLCMCKWLPPYQCLVTYFPDGRKYGLALGFQQVSKFGLQQPICPSFLSWLDGNIRKEGGFLDQITVDPGLDVVPCNQWPAFWVTGTQKQPHFSTGFRFNPYTLTTIALFNSLSDPDLGQPNDPQQGIFWHRTGPSGTWNVPRWLQSPRHWAFPCSPTLLCHHSWLVVFVLGVLIGPLHQMDCSSLDAGTPFTNFWIW